MATRFLGKIGGPVVLVGVILLLIGVPFAGVGLHLWLQDTAEQRRLEAAGQVAQGTVLRKSIHADRTGGGQTSFRIRYRFAPPRGEAVTGNAGVDLAVWEGLEAGGSIEVVYLPEAPSTHRVEGQQAELLVAVLFGVIGTVFTLFGGLFVALSLFRLRPRPAEPRPGQARRGAAARLFGLFGRSPLVLFGAVWLVAALPFVIAGAVLFASDRSESAQFAAEGQPAQGMVLSKAIRTERSRSTTSGASRTTTHYRVTYRYEGRYGEEVVGTSDVDPDVWDRLEERGPIAVTYLPQTPWLHRVEGEGGGWGGLMMLSVGLGAASVGGFALVKASRKPRRAKGTAKAETEAGRASVPRPDAEGLAARTAAASLPGLSGLSRVAPARRVWLRLPRGWMLPTVGGIFFVAGTALAIIGISQWMEEREYAATGMLAEGRIVAKAIEKAERGDGGETRYVASYRFMTARGEPAEGRYVLPVETWEALKEGDPVSVRYLPDRPRTNREAGQSGMGDVIASLLLGPVVAGVGGGMLYFVQRGWRRARRLRCEGIAAEAVITAAEPGNLRINKVRQWRIRYRYRDGTGREHEGRSGALPPEDAAEWQPGDAGAVRYDPKRPEDSLWMGRSQPLR